MENIEQIYNDFAEILSNEELENLAEKYNIVDKRIRRLAISIFFWLMVISACIPATRGGLIQLVGFFVASFCQIFPAESILSLTRMAISKKLKAHNWFFFRAVYNWKSMWLSLMSEIAASSLISRMLLLLMHQS